MTSPVRLEQSGGWRNVGLALCFLPALAAVTPLVWQAMVGEASSSVGAPFAQAMLASVTIGGIVAAIAFTLGLPAGVLAALYTFRGRSLLVAMIILPVLVPSLLWAIGWSALAAHTGPTASNLISGYVGCVLALTPMSVAIVVVVAFVTARSLTRSQLDAARLFGGENAAVLYACRHAAVPAALAAALAGVLSLSDPSPGMIFGLRTAAADVLTSFSALYDFVLAGRQCVLLAAAVLGTCVPLLLLAAPRLAEALLPRQLATAPAVVHPQMSAAAAMGLTFIALIDVFLPLIGLTLPLLDGADLSRAIDTVTRTAGNTLLYAVGAGLLGALLGLAVAFCVGRQPRLRVVALAMSLIVLVQPPALLALGLVHTGASAPIWADPLLRSRLTVCIALALRLFPIGVLLGLRGWGNMSPSWASAAAVHGVPMNRYLGRVVIPALAPSIAAAAMLIALLATADVSTILLLHPPGQRSLPLTIFTVMANAPQTLVASLSLAYVTAAAVLLTFLLVATRRRLT